MMEVDLDGSETMDFYEYLTIAHLLLEKKGIYYPYIHGALDGEGGGDVPVSHVDFRKS